MPDADPTLERLEDQIGWYDHKSNFNQRTFKWMKVIEIGAAGLVPLFSGFKLPWVAGSLGADRNFGRRAPTQSISLQLDHLPFHLRIPEARKISLFSRGWSLRCCHQSPYTLGGKN